MKPVPQHQPTLLLFAPIPWDAAATQRPQHLARELANSDFNVIYVDPGRPHKSESPLPNLLVVGEGVSASRRLVSGLVRRIPFGHNLQRFVQSQPIYDRFRRTLGAAEATSSIDVRLELKRPGVVLVQLPHFAPQALRLQRQGWRLIYDRLDPWSEMPGIGEVTQRYDRMLYARADEVIATTEALRCGPQGIDRPTTLIPNGVDLTHFRPRTRLKVVPPNLPSGKPIAGYIGSLGSWFDWQRVRRLARALPNWAFVLIGPGRIPRRLPENVHTPGPIDYKRLPDYLHCFDVGLIPFKGALVPAVDPVKAWEYLASEVPVLSVPFPALKSVPGVTLIEGDWSEALEAVAAGPFPQREVRQLLQGRTWKGLTSRLVDVIQRPPQPPELSVVIPNYNGLEHLKRCLPSMERQNHRSMELILVDDCSTDGSLEYCRREHPGVQIIEQPSNGGFARSANAGMRAARGRLIALLNNDTEMAPDWATEAVIPFANPEVGSVASHLCQMEKLSHIDRAGDGYSVAGAAFNRMHNQVDPTDHARREEVFGASAAAAVYRRAALVEVGLLDEAFDAYYEDVDLAWRLQLGGWRCVLNHAARGLHRGSASYQQGGERFVRFSSRNSEVVFWSNLPASVLLPHVHSHLLFLLLQTGHRIVRGELLPYLKGKLEVLGDLPRLLERRKQIQKLRIVDPRSLERLLEQRWFRKLVNQLIDRTS